MLCLCLYLLRWILHCLFFLQETVGGWRGWSCWSCIAALQRHSSLFCVVGRWCADCSRCCECHLPLVVWNGVWACKLQAWLRWRRGGGRGLWCLTAAAWATSCRCAALLGFCDPRKFPASWVSNPLPYCWDGWSGQAVCLVLPWQDKGGFQKEDLLHSLF